MWKDQEMALFGSDLEWLEKLSNEAAKGEPAWKGFGRKAGIHIWRYAKYKLTEWPKMDYGMFFSRDTYIILNSHRKHKSDVSACAYVTYMEIVQISHYFTSCKDSVKMCYSLCFWLTFTCLYICAPMSVHDLVTHCC